jgi:PleD family two-component response regulator
MRKILPFLFLAFVSCNDVETNNSVTQTSGELDSIITKSSKTIQVSDTVQKKSDIATEKKVFKVVTQIKYLIKSVEKLKIEKLELVRELKSSKENVRVDTVYIETKKNFWGKEKTTINVKSDSTVKENVDTLTTEKKVIDSLYRK